MGRILTALAIVSLLIAYLFVSGKARSQNRAGYILRESKAVCDLTLPAGGLAGELETNTDDPWSSRATWRLNSSVSWDEYVQWVRKQLKGSFTEKAVSSDRIAFARNVGGDAQSLDVQLLATGPPTQIQFTFKTIAD
jgi:hypothetical protein